MTNQQSTTAKPFDEFQLEMLTPNGAKVYRTVSSRMVQLNVSSLWISDAELSRRARVVLQNIGAAQSELARVGAFIMTPGIAQVRYELPDALDMDTETAR